MEALPDRVRIVEVGPRDGLQGEAKHITTEQKLAYIGRLIESGLGDIEIGAFVSPKAVPQMADTLEVAARLPAAPGVRYLALVPNYRGLEHALEAGLKRIAIFTAASNTFCEKNIRMSIARSLDVYGEVVGAALTAGLSVRAYLSTCFECPYEGAVPKQRVVELTERLLELGADEVVISDTTGSAAPREVYETVGCCVGAVSAEKIALHFHDTYGTGMANVLAGLELGVRTFDASAGGIGGCPFAPGAAGNIATEDLVYMLDRMDIRTGVDIRKVVHAARLLADALGRTLPSRNFSRLNIQNV
ncbi:MAG: hydroxymethylglutaryl-CoA lyase [Phycisphaerales bacterium]|nr:hydroxymethylglutaryl-CoA lyase [Phycisphaerales bacterium]